MKNEYEVYVENISKMFGELAIEKPKEMDAMAMQIEFSAGSRKPMIRVPLYDGIEKLADKLYRPVCIESHFGRFYVKVVRYGDIAFTETEIAIA